MITYQQSDCIEDPVTEDICSTVNRLLMKDYKTKQFNTVTTAA